MGIFAAIGATEPTALGQVGAAPSQSIPTVVWAPFSDPLPAGAVSSWEEAVLAVQTSTSPETSIHIYNPEQDDIYLPGGEWHLNNTTIVGSAVSAAYDEDFRGYQDLQYIEADGNTSQPTRIYGCVGLKNIYFRGSNNSGYDVSTTDSFDMPYPDDTVTVPVGGIVPAFAVDSLVRINSAGYFQVVSTDAVNNLLTVRNLDWSDNASPETTISSGQGVYPDTSVFQCRSEYGPDTTFTLDNCDFRFGNYTWGSFHVWEGCNLFLRLVNGASIRWYSFLVDGYCAVQGDGSPCWIGSATFFGNGTVDSFAQAGTFVRDNQDVSDFYRYQSYTMYYPNNSSNWGGSQYMSYHEALDRLAAACVAGGHTP